MATPAISIVIPLYNKAPEISRCLRSALGQTYANFEIIVIDDGSTDDGGAVVATFQDHRLRLLRQQNQGLAETRNNGVRIARSPIVAFLDADDEWLPSHLEDMMQLVRLHPEAGIYCTGFWLDRGGAWRRRIRLAKRYLRPGASLIADYFSIPDGRILPSASAVKKEAFLTAGGYYTMFGEDIDLLLRLASMFSVAYTPQATAIWHLDAGNRMCIEEAAEIKLHEPGSLLRSLSVIENNDRISVETQCKARDYVAARERRAILDTLLQGHRKHAADLYERWQLEYGRRSIKTELTLHVPRLTLKLFGLFSENLQRVRSMACYALEKPRSMKLFGPGL